MAWRAPAARAALRLAPKWRSSFVTTATAAAAVGSVEQLPSALLPRTGARRSFARRSARSPKVRGLQTPVWSPGIADCLARVNETVDEALLELRTLRADDGHESSRHSGGGPQNYPAEERVSDEWQRGFDALLQVHRSPAKHMLRPQLVLLGASAALSEFDPSSVPAMHAVEDFAAGVELQHLFMLVHDDVIDRATRRRGVAPVHVALCGEYLAPSTVSTAASRRRVGQVMGMQLATLIGDVVHARAMGLMFQAAVAAGAPRACDVLLHHSYKAAAAQCDDVVGWRGMEHIFAGSADPHEVMRQVLLDKGARHTMCAPLLGGLTLAGASEDVHLSARKWGEHAGIALQAMDDVADLIGNFITTGKDTFQDFRDGRLSLLLFLLWQRATPQEWSEVASFMRRGGETVMMPHERKYFMDIMDNHNLVPVALDLARKELDLADEAVASLPQGRVLRHGLLKFTSGLRGHCETLEEQADKHAADDDDGLSM